ncbi:y4mF family transcriptional regulator [Brevundimonas bullata]|uniref:Y4mF family transcriptional regulator n=1 Tax=Brevundimonas bullata TaxID=13160 RepID=A0A7W7IPV7_9CAUL|nr:helix-turn-helix transcriptional regulator [Brevundimonas bullata]MBB4798292.1 y4mF family transcriptional regulator [Brevundimonas bullata]MBB6383394.1 y4mF family transcriptional regulator [Brevundimonas bullata]
MQPTYGDETDRRLKKVRLRRLATSLKPSVKCFHVVEWRQLSLLSNANNTICRRTLTGLVMIIRSPRDLGSAVRARRKALGLDQAAVADRVGVSRQWIGALEHGKAGVELGLVLRTLKALDIPLSLGDDLLVSSPPFSSVDIDAIVDAAKAP